MVSASGRLAKLEKLEKPERECHVPMVTRGGNSAPLASPVRYPLVSSSLASPSTCSTFFQAKLRPARCTVRAAETMIILREEARSREILRRNALLTR